MANPKLTPTKNYCLEKLDSQKPSSQKIHYPKLFVIKSYGKNVLAERKGEGEEECKRGDRERESGRETGREPEREAVRNLETVLENSKNV